MVRNPKKTAASEEAAATLKQALGVNCFSRLSGDRGVCVTLTSQPEMKLKAGNSLRSGEAGEGAEWMIQWRTC